MSAQETDPTDDDREDRVVGTELDVVRPGTRVGDDESWLTSVVRPVGELDRERSTRLAAVLETLAEESSVVVVDLGAARLSGRRAAAVIAAASQRLEARGGYLLCVNVDEADRLALDGADAGVIALDASSTQQPGHPLALAGPAPAVVREPPGSV